MSRNWKDIPIPPRMQALEHDRRGFPVPFIVVRDKNNIPLFQINDDSKVEQCISEQLCAICGQHMPTGDRWLVGGPQNAFHPQGAYIDTPTHYECLHYALQVCPYLAVSKFQKRLDSDKLDQSRFEDTFIFQDPTQDDARVPFFVAIQISGLTVIRRPPHHRVLIANKPYLDIQYWNNGRRLSTDEMLLLMDQWLEKQQQPMYTLFTTCRSAGKFEMETLPDQFKADFPYFSEELDKVAHFPIGTTYLYDVDAKTIHPIYFISSVYSERCNLSKSQWNWLKQQKEIPQQVLDTLEAYFNS